MIDKIIEKLQKEYIPEVHCDIDNGLNRGIYKAIDIVKQVAAEENNGWIKCSDRLPENTDNVIMIDINEIYAVGWYDDDDEEFRIAWDNDVFTHCIAWQPLPQPYKEG